jgi:hypothetical protein
VDLNPAELAKHLLSVVRDLHDRYDARFEKKDRKALPKIIKQAQANLDRIDAAGAAIDLHRAIHLRAMGRTWPQIEQELGITRREIFASLAAAGITPPK